MNIDFTKDDFRFNARVSAIIYNKDKTKVLLFKVEDGRDFFLLPGGRIELYEESLVAVNREINEELGFVIDFKLCAINENFVIHNNKKNTQYDFCYKGIYNHEITFERIACKDNQNQSFYWVDISLLEKYKILPNYAYKLISLEQKNIEHYIEKNEY